MRSERKRRYSIFRIPPIRLVVRYKNMVIVMEREKAPNRETKQEAERDTETQRKSYGDRESERERHQRTMKAREGKGVVNHGQRTALHQDTRPYCPPPQRPVDSGS